MRQLISNRVEVPKRTSFYDVNLSMPGKFRLSFGGFFEFLE